MEKIKKGILWVRVSTEDQTKGYSQDAQKRACQKAAEREGVQITKEFIIHETGFKPRQEDFNEMIAYVKEKSVDFFFVYTVDRLARNHRNACEIEDLISDNGLAFRVVDWGNYCLVKDSPPEDFDRFWNAIGRASYESRKDSARTKQMMLEKVQQGGHPGLAPIGYLNVADPDDPELKKRTIIVDKERAPLIAKTFELYASRKYSLSSLRDELKILGLRTRKTKKRLSQPVSQNELAAILHDEFYTGQQRWAGILWPGKHEPLISLHLFEAVQKVLEENSQYINANRRPSSFFPFRQFLTCGFCGCRITAGEGWKNHKYYWCTKNKDPKCPQVNYREEKIDALIAAEIGNIHISEETVEAVKKELEKADADQHFGEKDKLKKFRNKIAQGKNKMGLLYKDRLAGDISLEMYQENEREIQKETAYWEGEISKLGKVNLNFKSQGIAVMGLLGNLKQAYQRQDFQGKAKILSIILDRCVLENGKTRMIWKEPFNLFFDMAAMIETQKNQVHCFAKRGE